MSSMEPKTFSLFAGITEVEVMGAILEELDLRIHSILSVGYVETQI